MSIVFGTDFSERAMTAARAAAVLARRTGEVLHLVHITEYGSAGRTAASDEALRRELHSRLEAQAAELRTGDARVEVHLLEGAPDEVLVEHAAVAHASLIIVSHHGQRGPRWRIGNVAERVVQSARCPVLVLRSAAPLEAWARGERSLRVLLGLDFSPPSDAAVSWVRKLRTLGSCEVVAAHHYWGADAHVRYGVPLSPESEVTPEVEEALRRDLTARLGDMPGTGAVWVHLDPGLSRPAESLVALARKEEADLIVVGTHQRTGASKWWYGSVSQRIVHDAPVSVLCVPASAVSTLTIPEVRRVLAPTDLSEVGISAIRHAYSIVPAGGAVYLLHVLETVGGTPPLSAQYLSLQGPAHTPEQERLAEVLRGLIPPEAAVRGISTRVEVVHGRKVSEAINQAAERLSCDVICLATHGRSGLSKALVGSVAQEVLQASTRPVLLVRPE
ncbi:nucleotide-binding universal stress UspA family protein [Archangium gephyra]|uniref:Nucleotide-binding universal stress UspA family protein n=1 Tax=Archangium gephyra TaxID=48 RepID=A0ABX9KB24_9BACT|nr:universal stress protein [Archangium gephyra]REG37332.1 nucleotide-binding universal stress UspA family protein [Archangium gephyra]